jgi:succinyl-CoA synthetase alpha subunit
MTRIALISTAAIVLVMGLAASAFAATTTRDEYTAAVEPICKVNTQANERILAGVKQEVRQGKLKPAAAKFARAAAELKKTLNQLRAVSPPPADKARVAEWLAGVKLESELFASVAKKLNAGQKGAAEHMVALLSTNASKTNVVMLPFEFRYCRLEPTKFT